MQASGDGVSGPAELAARMELRHDELDAGELGLAFGIHRDPAAVVADLDRAVGAQDHLDALGPSAHGLVDGVVDDLPHAVEQAAAVVGPDVHPGALPHRVQALEHREVACGVSGLCSTLRLGHGGRLTMSGARAAATRPVARPVNPLTNSDSCAARRPLS